MKNDEAKKIVDTLKRCCCTPPGKCDECMFYPYRDSDCTSRMGFAASNLIEHQSAEIEALNNRIADMSKAMMYNAKQYALRREHGHWEVFEDCSNDGWYCSECHKKIYEYKPSIKKHLKNFCPNCGAKMDKEEHDGVR